MTKVAPVLHLLPRVCPRHYLQASAAPRLGRHGDIPAINTLANIGNLVSIRYAMPLAVFELANRRCVR